MPRTVPFVAAAAFQVLEYLDQVRENRTGVSRYSQGLSPDALNKTATGIQIITNAAERRVKLIARCYGEGGVKQLFKVLYWFARNHQQEQRMVRLRNKFVPIDPSQWGVDMDFTVSVGVGTGNKDQQLQHLYGILNMQKEALALQGGADGPVVKLENVWNTAAKITEAAGFRQPEMFFTKPDENQPPKQPQPDPAMAKIMADSQAQQAKIQLEREKAIADIQLEREKMMAELQMQRERMMAEISLGRSKVVLAARGQQMQGDPNQPQPDGMAMPDTDANIRDPVDDIVGAIREGFAGFAAAMSRPKRVIRNPVDGKVEGIQ